jgi:hypothetical protein
MKTGSYKKATCFIKLLNGEMETTNLFVASMTVYPTGMAEITHYLDGVKDPSNKHTLCIPVTQLGFFRGSGDAD